MSPATPHQLRTRARFEALIGLAAPALDLLLAAGERVSRVVGREDDYIPIRPASDRLELGRGGPDLRPGERLSHEPGDQILERERAGRKLAGWTAIAAAPCSCSPRRRSVRALGPASPGSRPSSSARSTMRSAACS